MNFSSMVDSLLQAALPARCQLCGEGTDRSLLCQPCRAELPWNQPCCPGCALPTAVPTLCAECAATPQTAFDSAFSALRLEGSVQRAVHRLKYSQRLHNARFLAEAMAEGLRRTRSEPLPQLLLPMPLAYGRQLLRGFNQALEISRALGRELGIAVDTGAARRLRPTADQIGQSRKQRQANVKAAFAVGPTVAGLHIAVVDDVMTTGASLAELARMAKDAGALRVEAWSAARTPKLLP